MDKRKRKRWIVLAALCALLACLIPYLLWANAALTVSHVELDLLPGEGSFTIAQVSDLHNAEFGGGNRELLAILEEAEPDLIAITGDLIDSRRTDPAPALAFLEGAVELAPVCYVTGNHEFRVYDAYQDLKSQMEELGVIVLENESMVLEEVPLRVIGLDDPSFGVRSDPSATPEQILQGALTALAPQAGGGGLVHGLAGSPAGIRRALRPARRGPGAQRPRPWRAGPPARGRRPVRAGAGIPARVHQRPVPDRRDQPGGQPRPGQQSVPPACEQPPRGGAGKAGLTTA